ncbi:hypothetical protein ACGFY7_07750 [Streptomyces prunicolor]|uniref:hypothetical protein n=1 Tax=Streptomyces prunicolor TaxID=67348 RepID=UPI003715153B
MPVTGSANEPGSAGYRPDEVEMEMEARRPRVITVAFWLLIAAPVLWLPVLGDGDPADMQSVGLILSLYLWFAVRVRHSRWKARIAVTATAVWLIVVLGARARGFTAPEYPYGRVDALLDVIAVLSSAIGVALLHGHRGNAFFRRRPR